MLQILNSKGLSIIFISWKCELFQVITEHTLSEEEEDLFDTWTRVDKKDETKCNKNIGKGLCICLESYEGGLHQSSLLHS